MQAADAPAIVSPGDTSTMREFHGSVGIGTRASDIVAYVGEPLLKSLIQPHFGSDQAQEFTRLIHRVR
jgi:hypothetical protein